MRLSAEKLKRLCRQRRMPLKDLLREAGVSRTAYYGMVRKESVLPKSICRVADRLGVSPSSFLSDDSGRIRRIRELQARTDEICRLNPECDRDVVFRTLMNLDLPPVERLRKALNRARKTGV
jgi:transcriptional regulator with XRE-family HTH domain